MQLVLPSQTVMRHLLRVAPPAMKLQLLHVTECLYGNGRPRLRPADCYENGFGLVVLLNVLGCRLTY